MTAWFISDIHIKDINERRSIQLLRFLRLLCEKKYPATHLFLLGDIFDLWISNASFFIRKYQTFIDLILELKKSGVEIYYFEGNHDIHVKHFWQEMGISTFDSFQYFDLANFKVRLEHGDMINEEEINYRRLRETLRHPLTEKIAPFVPGRLLNEIGQLASHFSRQRSSRQREGNTEKLKTMIRNHAERTYEQQPFDYIITGHVHVLDEYKFKVGKNQTSTSINLGSWFDGPHILRLDNNGHSWLDLLD